MQATISFTPAAFASVTVWIEVEASGAVPPGTYTPTRSIGEKNSPARPPRGVFIVQGARRDAFEKRSTRACASLTARFSAAGTAASTFFSSAAETRNCAGASLAPSNFATYSATAASPRARIAASTADAAVSASAGNALRARNDVTTLLGFFFADQSTILNISRLLD